jgi:hypothetical protein
MNLVVQRLIETLKQEIRFVEHRPGRGSVTYLETVLLRQDLASCCSLLQQALGPPLKDFGQSAQFEPAIQRVVALLGGIRIDQCLFFARGEGQQVGYAALWPWASDPNRITLRVGLSELRP